MSVTIPIGARPRLRAVAMLCAAALAATGCRQGAAPAAGPTPRGVPVRAASAVPETLTEHLRAVGTLLADESVMLRPEIAGRIARIHVDEGQPVAAGTLLISLDAAEQRARVAQIEASVELDRLNHARAQDLARTRMVSAQDFDQARARLKESTALLERERVLLARTKLRAPFAGVLGLRQVSPGAYVQPGQDLVNLEALDPLKVEFRVPERYAAALRVGHGVRLEADAAPGRDFAGTVYAINPALDARSRAFALRAHVPNLDGLLRPGMFARVEMVLAERTQALVIPEQAIVPRGEQMFVFRVTDGKAAFTPVRTGLRVPGKVEVLEGLAAGDVVVTAGQMKLRDGVPVELLPPSAPAAPAGAS